MLISSKLELNKDLINKLKDTYQLSVGFRKDKYPNGVEVSEVAQYNEFGHLNRNGTITPPRPFMRSTMSDKMNSWSSIFSNAITNGDVKNAFEIMGDKMVEDIKNSIIAWSVPANAPATIKKKGFNDPLIDTKLMLNSVDKEVVKI